MDAVVQADAMTVTATMPSVVVRTEFGGGVVIPLGQPVLTNVVAISGNSISAIPNPVVHTVKEGQVKAAA